MSAKKVLFSSRNGISGLVPIIVIELLASSKNFLKSSEPLRLFISMIDLRYPLADNP
jgi:hypothetical protein